MLRIALLTSILFFLVLFFFPAASFEETPSLSYLWRYDLVEDTESARPAALQRGFNAVLYSDEEGQQ